ncbi:MAG TPA: serine hydrolase [Ramlibacter sp.]|nr:serine hydrolase [Ramlibacter sp.]
MRELPAGAGFDLQASIEGHVENIDSFMQRYHTAALIVVKDGKVRVERYRYGNTVRSKWVMFSVTKSFVSTAVAAALHEGLIRLDDPVASYVPELRGSGYGDVPVQDLLNMTSGVDRQNAHETPGANPQRDAYYSTDPNAVFAYLRTLTRSSSLAGCFNYNDADTHVLGLAATRAVGMPLATYISERIWKPAGMEEDGHMRLTVAGQEVCHGGLSLTLRDLARFGLFVLDDAVAGGRRYVPEGWFAAIGRGPAEPDSTRAPGRISNAPDFGYQNHWWTIPSGRAAYELGDDGGFAALGIYGQQVYVVPGLKLVLAMQSANVVGREPPLFNRGRELATAIAKEFRTGRR